MDRLGVALGAVSREHRLEGVEMREGGAGSSAVWGNGYVMSLMERRFG